MTTTYSGPLQVAAGWLIRDQRLPRRPRDEDEPGDVLNQVSRGDQLAGGIKLAGEDSAGRMWAATIFGPNSAAPKGADAERVRRLGRDRLAELGPGRSDDDIAGLREWQRRLDRHYGR